MNQPNNKKTVISNYRDKFAHVQSMWQLTAVNYSWYYSLGQTLVVSETLFNDHDHLPPA